MRRYKAKSNITLKKPRNVMRFPEFILEESKNEEEDLKNYLLHVYRDAVQIFPNASKKHSYG